MSTPKQLATKLARVEAGLADRAVQEADALGWIIEAAIEATCRDLGVTIEEFELAARHAVRFGRVGLEDRLAAVLDEAHRRITERATAAGIRLEPAARIYVDRSRHLLAPDEREPVARPVGAP